jgi:predicted ATPase
MIVLKCVHIEGFRSIRTMAEPLEFGPLTVLVGANGSGKSNLLSFFGMLNRLTQESLQNYIAKQGGANALLHFGPKMTKTLGGRLDFQSGTGITSYEFQLTHAHPDRLIFTRETVDYRAENLAPHHEPLSLDVGHRETALAAPQWSGNGTVKFFQRALRGFRAYQFHDTSAESALRRGRSEERRTKPFYDDGANLPAVLFRLSEKHPEVYHLVRKTVQLVAPFFADFEFEFVDRGPDEGRDILLSWRSVGPDYTFGMYQLSDGTLRFIALAVLLLLPAELRPVGAILIDEPELGLHPKALSVLAGLIRSASAEIQVICTTQSPTLLDNFAPEEVAVVERESGNSTFRRLGGAELEAWKDDYTLGEMWVKNLFGGRPHRD